MVLIYEIDPSSTEKDINLLNSNLNDSSKKIIYVVHRPGCPACDAFMPNWNTFKNNIKQNYNDNIVLAKINVSVVALINLKDKNKIKGVPHIMLQKGKYLEPYTGNRLPQDLEKWLLSNTTKLYGGKKSKRRISKKSHRKSTKKQRKSRRRGKSRRERR